MNTLNALFDGFATALTFANLGWALLGVTLGTAIGILPGIGPALTIALLLPLTSHLDPTAAFIMFAGLYYGAMYGSSTTSILLNTPGESGSIITAIEGNLMARKEVSIPPQMEDIPAVIADSTLVSRAFGAYEDYQDWYNNVSWKYGNLLLVGELTPEEFAKQLDDATKEYWANK